MAPAKKLQFTYYGLENPSHTLATIKLWEGDDIVGTIMVRKGEILPPIEVANPHTRCWQVAGIDVVENFRRRGFGTILYQEAARIVATHGLALCSDIPGSLDSKAEAFWHKQVVKGHARWEIPGAPENEDRNFDFGRYVLKYPPPASLAGSRIKR